MKLIETPNQVNVGARILAFLIDGHYVEKIVYTK